MHPLKAPGPDGLPALFFQKFWHIIGQEVTELALGILNGGGEVTHLNHTYICLILKVKKPTHTWEFRPISLCNEIFKIVTKTIANRLKIILPSIVGPYQSAFVLGRLMKYSII